MKNCTEIDELEQILKSEKYIQQLREYEDMIKNSDNN